jgi:hypothetical protein
MVRAFHRHVYKLGKGPALRKKVGAGGDDHMMVTKTLVDAVW